MNEKERRFLRQVAAALADLDDVLTGKLVIPPEQAGCTRDYLYNLRHTLLYMIEEKS